MGSIRLYSPSSTSIRRDHPELRPGHRRRDERNVETRRIGTLVNTWLMARDKAEPNPEAVHKVERKLHAAIKGSLLFGRVLTFAGLNIWVDDRTLDGVVESQESINL